MNYKKILSMITIFVIPISLFSANLGKSIETDGYLVKLSKKAITSSVDLNATGILEKEEVTGAPIAFEVLHNGKDDSEIERISNVVGNGFDVRYSKKKYKYFSFNIDLQMKPLEKTDEASLEILKKKAIETMKILVGKDADRFVFANTETEWVALTPGSDDPTLLSMTYRFTRKVNGRHIIDNTSYVRVCFSGNDELSGFEIINPDLKPVKLDMLVKLSATEERLEKFAEDKKTARKWDGKNVIVNTINAEKGVNTYIKKEFGEKTILIPHVSFYSKFDLENGDSFNNWIHLSLDASTTPNLDDDMIEGLDPR